MSRRVRIVPAFAAALLAAAPAALPHAGAEEPAVGDATRADAVARGRGLAEALCSECHAVGGGGESPHADAPAFRTLSRNYPVKYLEEALGEGIVVGHGDMPEIVLPPEEIGPFIAYLESIQDE